MFAHLLCLNILKTFLASLQDDHMFASVAHGINGIKPMFQIRRSEAD